MKGVRRGVVKIVEGMYSGDNGGGEIMMMSVSSIMLHSSPHTTSTTTTATQKTLGSRLETAISSLSSVIEIVGPAGNLVGTVGGGEYEEALMWLEGGMGILRGEIDPDGPLRWKE